MFRVVLHHVHRMPGPPGADVPLALGRLDAGADLKMDAVALERSPLSPNDDRLRGESRCPGCIAGWVRHRNDDGAMGDRALEEASTTSATGPIDRR